MPTMDTRIDVSLPGELITKAAVRGLCSPGDSRSFVIRYALMRLIPGFDDVTAMRAATPTETGGRKKTAMAPTDNRVAVHMPSEHLSRIKDAMPDGVNMSQMTRYALYRLAGWDEETALAEAMEYTENRNRRQKVA